MKIIDTDGTEITEHTFDNWQKEWETKHPLLNKIDNLFDNKSIADYRASYAIIHPWVFISYLWGHVCWAWQRVFRGWDDRVIWSINFYLAKMIPAWMRQLKKDKHGTPMMMFKDEDLDPNGNISDEVSEQARLEYDTILESIVLGFESYIKMEEMGDSKSLEYKAEGQKFNNGFDLFRKYFETFWD